MEGAYDVAPPDIQGSLVNPENGALNPVFRTGPGSLDDRGVYVNEIRDELDVGERSAGAIPSRRASGPPRRVWPW